MLVISDQKPFVLFHTVLRCKKLLTNEWMQLRDDRCLNSIFKFLPVLQLRDFFLQRISIIQLLNVLYKNFICSHYFLQNLKRNVLINCVIKFSVKFIVRFNEKLCIGAKFKRSVVYMPPPKDDVISSKRWIKRRCNTDTHWKLEKIIYTIFQILNEVHQTLEE